MPFTIDATSRRGILHLGLTGTVRAVEMDAFVNAHNAAIVAFAGADYRVFCDIRGLAPLAPDAAARFEEAKAFSAAAPNFRGSAVIATSVVVAMQHERTSVSSGVIATELITDDESAAWDHLEHVHRQVTGANPR